MNARFMCSHKPTLTKGCSGLAYIAGSTHCVEQHGDGGRAGVHSHVLDLAA